MAGELQIAHATAKTVYAQIRSATGTIWNTAGTPAFESYNTSNIGDYDIALTEQGTASGYYVGTFPTGITTPGAYTVTYFERAGGSPAETDIKLGVEVIQWSGTAVVPLYNAPVNVQQFGGTNGSFSGGRPAVNTTYLNGTAWTSTALGKIYGILASDTVTDASTMPTQQTFDAASLSATDSNYYRGKKILWTSGNNAGLTSTISASSWGGTYTSITLALALPSTVAAADAFILLPESSESNPVMWANNYTSPSLFTGITTLAQWLGLLAGKQTGNSTARTEIRATGAGSGSYDETTDSLQAVRDRGDAAWTTGGGLDAAGVRAAVGLGSANLDTQLADLPTVAEFEARTLVAANYFDPSADEVTVGTNNDKTGYSLSGTLTTLDAAWAKMRKWFQLLFRKDSAISTDYASEITEINENTGTGTGSFSSQTDSIEAIRDRGDAAWTSGSGGDWTSDEKTVIKAVLGIPASGTTPDAPTTGVLAIIRDRIGAFTGTGVNTVLGFFKALLRKDASNPSDVGGTFDPAADSTEAISEAAAAVKAKTDQFTFSTANRVDAQVFGMEANTLNASALATDAVNEINSASNPLILQTTTIATLASQVSFTLTAGSADDDAYNGCIAVVTDSSTATQKAKGVVLQYIGASKTVKLAFDPGVFTMATGDAISIVAANETPVVHAEMSVKSTAGSTAQLTAWMEVAGTRVPVTTIDAAATCGFVVREHGSGSNLFTKSGAASDVTNSMFEVEQASPAFTDDRQYELTATITLNSVAYSTTHSRVVIG